MYPLFRFENGDTSCSLTVSIIDTSQYEKDKIFHVRLSEPRMITTQEERLKGRVLTKQERFIDLKGQIVIFLYFVRNNIFGLVLNELKISGRTTVEKLRGLLISEPIIC